MCIRVTEYSWDRGNNKVKLLKRHIKSIMIKNRIEISFHILCRFSDTPQKSFQTNKKKY